MADEAAEGQVGSEGAVTDAGDGVVSEGLTEGETGEAASGAVEEPELYTVKIGGREERVTLDEALSGYMRDGDYRRKTQELAQQREAVQQMFALQAALERDPRTTLATLAGALGVELGAAQANAAVQQGEEDPFAILTSKVDSLASTLTAQQQAALQAQQQAQQAAQAQAQIERETAELKSVHGDFDERALWQFAAEHGVVNLGVAFRAWQFEQQEQQRIAEQNRAVEAKRKAQVVSGGRATSSAGAVVPGGSGANGRMSVREAFAAALAASQ